MFFRSKERPVFILMICVNLCNYVVFHLFLCFLKKKFHVTVIHVTGLIPQCGSLQSAHQHLSIAKVGSRVCSHNTATEFMSEQELQTLSCSGVALTVADQQGHSCITNISISFYPQTDMVGGGGSLPLAIVPRRVAEGVDEETPSLTFSH